MQEKTSNPVPKASKNITHSPFEPSSGSAPYVTFDIMGKIPVEITQGDYDNFDRTVSTDLSLEQIDRIVNIPPEKVCPQQDTVVAVHWHPEFIPMDLIRKRIDAIFPNRNRELIIPTQHNVLMEYGEFAGVEVDCYSSGFNEKVQILLHFDKSKIESADVLKKMLAHTFKYRASQLFEYMHTITRPMEDRIGKAAAATGAGLDIVEFARIYVCKIEKMIDQRGDLIPQEMFKNKVIRNFFDLLRSEYGDAWIDRVQTYLKAVKKIVKENFSLKYFYRTSEVIEEARALGGCIIIPHPEQFWPALLADYDVDGWEVWNPQSMRYTEFLISTLNTKNGHRTSSQRPILVFMGDDTHMGEKVKEPKQQNKSKAGREIGVQPAWDDMSIKKNLILSNMDKSRVMDEYRARLLG